MFVVASVMKVTYNFCFGSASLLINGMKTFFVQTLGCKVNQYESQQIAAYLRGRGLCEVSESGQADLRVVNTCSVTMQAASKSRQLIRRSVALPVLGKMENPGEEVADYSDSVCKKNSRLIVTGCWATSDEASARAMPGVDAVITHKQDVAAELGHWLDRWNGCDGVHGSSASGGTTTLPLLSSRIDANQRAMLKIQDGCDAHCTYCIIPKLRPTLWSKPPADAVAEAQNLVNAGHHEIVLTGIFLGAYGQPTALRRRQTEPAGSALARLISQLCEKVHGLKRLRLSSIEPGDLTAQLLETLRRYPQITPHFHIPLQSGSERLLRRMNRQYGRDDFRRLVEQLKSSFDRPALTTDIITGFPGETDEEFAQTVEVVEETGFIHIHVFSYSPRQGTAAARWKDEFVHGPVVNDRINHLRQLAESASVAYRKSFIGERAKVLVERQPLGERSNEVHGRCERYFTIHFNPAGEARPGDEVEVEITGVEGEKTWGVL